MNKKNQVSLILALISAALLVAACGGPDHTCGLSISLEGSEEGESFFKCAGGQGLGPSIKMGFLDDSTGTSVLIESAGPTRDVEGQDYPATITVKGPDFESQFSCSIHVADNQETEARINEPIYSVSGIGRCGRSVELLDPQSPYRVVGEFRFTSSVKWRSIYW